MKKTILSIISTLMILTTTSSLFATNITEIESNGTEGTAQAISLNFINNEALDTINASFNSGTDVDYYAITIPANTAYELKIDALDGYTESAIYDTDIKFSTKNGVTWSSSTDSYGDNLFFAGAITILIKVEHYGSTTDLGAYGLEITAKKGSYQTVSLNYTANTANSTTTGSILTAGNAEYYIVNFPAGYNYSLNANLFDKYNLNGGSYTCDGEFFYKQSSSNYFNGGYDSQKGDIIIPGNSTMIFKVDGYFISSTGTYALNLVSTRMTTDLMSLDKTSFTYNQLEAYNGNYITCTGNWTASSNQSFVTLDATSGSGNGYVYFNVSANTTYSSRTATITLSYNGGTKTFTIEQAAAIYPDAFEVNNSEATASTITSSFVLNNVSITLSANLHALTDTADYYKIVLPAGYTYTITSNADDSYNNSSYTVDTKYYYKVSNGNWSDYEDTSHPSFAITNGGTLYLKVKSYSVGNIGTYALNVNISRSVYTDNNEAETSSVKVYPNPSNGSFTVETEEEGAATIQILSLGGATLSSTEVNDSKNTIETNLPSGSYIVQYNKDGKSHINKLIIKK